MHEQSHHKLWPQQLVTIAAMVVAVVLVADSCGGRCHGGSGGSGDGVGNVGRKLSMVATAILMLTMIVVAPAMLLALSLVMVFIVVAIAVVGGGCSLQLVAGRDKDSGGKVCSESTVITLKIVIAEIVIMS